MTTHDSLKLKQAILSLSKKNILSYCEVREKINVKSDVLSKTIKKLHKKGLVTHKGRGKFQIEDEPIEIYIFIYGSLKKGFDNHDILKDAKYISKAETIRSFAMFEETSGNYPYLLKEENKGYSKIKGELYKIYRKDILKNIDSFEGAPNYYKREKIKIKTKKEVKVAETYFFTKNVIPSDQEPISEWTKDNNHFLKVFEEQYKKSICG